MTHPPTNETAFESPVATREHAMQLLPPGITDSQYRLGNTLGRALAETTTTTLAESVQSIEALLWSRRSHIGITLHPSRTRVHNTSEAAAHVEQTDADLLASQLEHRLPDWVGLQRGRLVLDPLGLSATATSRIVQTGKPSTQTFESLLKEIITDCHRRAVPVVCQLLITRSSPDRYSGTIRVAEFQPSARPFSRQLLGKSLRCTPTDGVTTQAPNGIASSRQLIRKYWTTDTCHRADDVRYLAYSNEVGRGKSRSQADTARWLAGSRHEYQALLAGRPAPDPYSDLNCKPTISLSGGQLDSLLEIFPWYEQRRWPQWIARRPPWFQPAQTYVSAVGTDHDWVTDTAAPDVSNLGTASASSLHAFAMAWLAENGCMPTTVAEDTTGNPQIRGNPSGDDAPVVITTPDAGTDPAITSSGALIKAANDAFCAGQQLLVITSSVSAARSVRDVLFVPYKTIHDDETIQPYSLPTPVRINGEVLVCKRDRPKPIWSVTPDGMCRLFVDETIAASGPVARSECLEMCSLPTAVSDREQATVLEPDGTPRESFAGTDELLERYRTVPQPVIPTCPLFVSTVTVAVREGSDLIEPSARCRWQDTADNWPLKSDLQRALSTFVTRHTVPATESGVGGFSTAFHEWYHTQRIEPPDDTVWYTSGLPSGVRTVTDDSRQITGLENRRWRVPVRQLSTRGANRYQPPA